jgi:hypothetical protein
MGMIMYGDDEMAIVVGFAPQSFVNTLHPSHTCDAS